MFSRFKRRFALPALATALAGVFLLSVVTNALFHASPALPANPHLQAADNGEPTDAPAPDLSQMAAWHLFGQSDPLGHPETGTEAEMAAIAAGLGLKLRGVFYLGPNKPARAIIESSDQTQKAYQAQAQLPGGEILQAIESHKAILLVNNQEVPLPLSKDAADMPPGQ